MFLQCDATVHAFTIGIPTVANRHENHEILMVHPEYYIYLRKIIKKMDEIIEYNTAQPVINKKVLADIGLIYEDLHFVDYRQLNSQIKNKIIQNKINSLLNK